MTSSSGSRPRLTFRAGDRVKVIAADDGHSGEIGQIHSVLDDADGMNVFVKFPAEKDLYAFSAVELRRLEPRGGKAKAGGGKSASAPRSDKFNPEVGRLVRVVADGDDRYGQVAKVMAVVDGEEDMNVLIQFKNDKELYAFSRKELQEPQADVRPSRVQSPPELRIAGSTQPQAVDGVATSREGLSPTSRPWTDRRPLRSHNPNTGSSARREHQWQPGPDLSRMPHQGDALRTGQLPPDQTRIPAARRLPPPAKSVSRNVIIGSAVAAVLLIISLFMVFLSTNGFRDERSYQQGYQFGYSNFRTMVGGKLSPEMLCRDLRTMNRLSSDRYAWDEGDLVDGCMDGIADAAG